MRLRLSLVDPARGGDGHHDVLVQAPAGARFGELRPHLAALVHDGADRMTVDGRVVEDDDVVGAGALVRGALLSVHRSPGAPAVAPGRMPLGSATLLALHVVGGPGAGRTVPLHRGEHVVGRAASSSIRLDDAGVSRAHCIVTVSDDGVHVRDLDPTNLSTIDGVPVPARGCFLPPGVRVRVGSTTLVVRRVHTPIRAAAAPEDGVVRFNRRPRFVSAAQPVTIRFPRAPDRPAGVPAPVIASLAPLVVSVGLAAVLRSPALLLFAVMSPVMLIGQWWADRRQGRLSHRAQVALHRRLTQRARDDLELAVRVERDRRHEASPDLALAGVLAAHHDSRLWQRRPGDPDHLVLRLGTATQPSGVVLQGHDEADDGATESPLAGKRADSDDPGDGPRRVPHEGPDALSRSAAGRTHGKDRPGEPPEVLTARDVPVTIDLERHQVVGVAGPRERVLSLVAGLLAQTAVWHSPRHVRFVVLTTDPDAASTWGWAARLPHALGADDGPIAHVASSDDPAAVRSRVDELKQLVDDRREDAWDARRTNALPRFVVVLDGARELRATTGISELLAAAPETGLRVVCIDDRPELLPAETLAQVVLDEGQPPRATMDLPDRRITDVTPDLPDGAWLESLSRRLACLEDATPDETTSAVPASAGFAAAHAELDLEPTTVEGVLQSWSRSDGRPVAVLGLTSEGPLRIDLAQDGPHCLVGGTTGSGKSELLQTLVAGLAVGSRPDELGFVLIDYKGGSAFKECARLPQTLGVVTDLDEQLTARALTSFRAELKRREALLARIGAKDAADYRAHRILDPSLPPLPRLVLVVDEFKVLADELPDFVEGLVRIAAVGRSLGVHLVLATQRPAGIITGDMRANIALRIALRVRDRADSDDVIESPAAAQISDRTPGRAWLRTAGNRLVEVQTAHAGRPMNRHRPSDGAMTVQVRTLTWADLARPAPTLDASGWSASQPSGPTVETELAAVVAAVRGASTRLALEPLPSPWLPPLPEVMAVDDLAPCPQAIEPQSGIEPGLAGVRSLHHLVGAVPLGLEDLPEAQSQLVRTWHPVSDGNLGIAGGSRTGRSSALRAIATGMAERWSPSQVHLHVLEGTPGSLADLAALPHVGSVTGSADPSLAARVVRRLEDELHSPRADVASAQVQIPAVVLLVDGWEALEDSFDGVDHGLPSEALLRLARDGLAAGVRVVVTGGRALLAGRLAGLLQQRLVLPMPDPLDLTLAGLAPADVQAHRTVGRAIDLATGHPVQLAHIGEDPGPLAQTRATASVAQRATARWGGDTSGHPWRMVPLPASVAWDRLPALDSGLLVVGIGGDDASAVGFRRGHDKGCILVTGPARSGRSNALACIVRQLAAAGHPTAVVVSGRSPLTQLAGLPLVHVLGVEDVRPLSHLVNGDGDLAVMIDDADVLDGTPVEPVVLDALRDQRGWFAASVDSRRAPSLYRGVVPELAGHGNGLVLSPTAVTDGDLLGVRVEVPRQRQPGRGCLVVDGQASPVQVVEALSDVVSPDRTASRRLDIPSWQAPTRP